MSDPAHDWLELEEEARQERQREAQEDAAKLAADQPQWRKFGDAVRQAVQYIDMARQVAPVVESPIEAQLGGYLAYSLAQRTAVPFAIYVPGSDVEYHERHILLIPQFSLGGYRYDFAIKFSDDPKPLILIECDGAEFHRTEQRIANDRRKDAAAEAAGITLFRFTGSDIFKHSDICATLVCSRLGVAL